MLKYAERNSPIQQRDEEEKRQQDRLVIFHISSRFFFFFFFLGRETAAEADGWKENQITLTCRTIIMSYQKSMAR